MPLIVIFCKAIGNVGFSESGIENILKGTQGFIRDGTLDNSKEETQIEALFSRRMGIIHSANLEAPLPDSPDMPVLMPDHLAKKVLVKGIIDDTILMLSIGLEPSSKSGVPVLMPLKSLLESIPIGIDNDCLLLGEMNCKTQDTGLMILNLKEVKAPVCLTAADIVRIQVMLDLIMGIAKLHSGAIMALVHILVDILDSFN